MSIQVALAGTAAAIALMAGLAVCRADPLNSSLIGAWAASAADCARLFAGLSAAGRQVRPSRDYHASAVRHTFQHMPDLPCVARKRRDQGGCGLQRLHQLYDPDHADHNQIRQRNRIQSHRRSGARHHFDPMPPVGPSGASRPPLWLLAKTPCRFRRSRPGIAG